MSTAIAASLPHTMAMPRDQEVIDVDLLDDDDDDVVFLHRSVRRRLDEDGSYVSSSRSSNSARGEYCSHYSQRQHSSSHARPSHLSAASPTLREHTSCALYSSTSTVLALSFPRTVCHRTHQTK